MHLKKLIESVERLRASGIHPYAEVIIEDGTSRIAVDSIEIDRGRIVITPAYVPAEALEESE